MTPPGDPLHLPEPYLRGFATAPMPGEAAPHLWVFRAATGEWRRWPSAPARDPSSGAAIGPERHFNQADPALLARLGALWEELEALEPRVAPLLGEGLTVERRLDASDRAALARWAALVGVRNTKGAGDLTEEQARAGASSLADALAEMGWVLWVASPPDYFVGSSTPFHAAFPKGDESQTTGFDVTSPRVEITFPLSPRVALHATWARRGEHWRRAREEVVLEINGRTCLGAKTWLCAPQPAVPG